MRFLHPSLLIWSGLLAVPIILYLFRPRPKKVRVSTLPFFKALAREHQESSWLRRLKRLLSLLLSLLVILGAVGALARLVVAPAPGELKSVVILVDRSASMAARDAHGVTRLQAALTRIRQNCAGLGGGVAVMVMAYDRRPEILLSRSLDRREVERALARIEVRPVEGDSVGALRLARKLAALETPASIWHATDGPRAEQEAAGPSALNEPPAVTVRHLCVALKSPVNAGITAFQLRRPPLERARLEAFVQVHCSAPGPADAELEVRVDDVLTRVRRMTLEPGGRERLLVPVTAGEGSTLTLRVSTPGDVLPLDDEVHALIPELRPVRVLWVSPSPDPFTELALASLGRGGDIEIYQGGPSAWPPKEAVDVAVFDDWLPDEWPEHVSVVVINPPRSSGPVNAVRIAGGGLPLDAPRATREGHPLLYGVATVRIALTQTAVLEADGPLEPVWVGPSGPVLLAGDVRGQRLVVMGFEPGRCERLPLMASYPLLIGNAIYWSAQAESGASLESGLGKNLKTGDLVRLEGNAITWLHPARGASVPLRARWTELDRTGLWRTDAGEAGSASLLSRRETVLAAAPSAEDGSGSMVRAGAGAILRGDLSLLFLWAVLGLLVAESWLYHRHAVH